ncbi:MAG: carbohydrate ABC transporter permease [Clostridia bacterium]|nr:carbohydrate ABC transporter permease [Clostridia bacterium]
MAHKKQKMKAKGLADKIFFIVLFTFLVLYVISILGTLFWGLLSSFKSVADIEIKKNVLGLPNPVLSAEELRFSNYAKLLDAFGFTVVNPFYQNGVMVTHYQEVTLGVTLVNTLMFTVITSIENAVLPCMAAYLCVRYPFKVSGFIYSTLLVLMVIPIVGTYPAEIEMLRSLGIYDTMIAYFIQNFNFTGMYFFIFYAYFEGLSTTYYEAAEIDGASQLMIMLKIALPLAFKLIMTIWLLRFIGHWNEYGTILLYMPTQVTLAFVIYRTFISTMNGEHSVGEVTAGCTVLAFPLVIIFICFREQLMGNLTLGGEKG